MMKICNNSCKSLIVFLLKFICELVGLRLLADGFMAVPDGAALVPDGCRVIPAGHYNFDPAIARQLGGRDNVNKAIILQYVLNWLQTNEKAGRNQIDGRTWSYNSGPEWTKYINLWNTETVEKHLRSLEQSGHLVSNPMNAHKGDQTKWYARPEKDSEDLRQMPLWGNEKTPTTGVKAHDDSSIALPAISLPAPVLPTTPAPARARKPKDHVGAVARFPGMAESNKDLPEPKPEVAEARPGNDHIDQPRDTNAPTPLSAAPPSWASIFTRIDDEIGGWLAEDCDRLKAWCQYAPSANLGGGYVRDAMRVPGCWPPEVPKSEYTSGAFASFVMS